MSYWTQDRPKHPPELVEYTKEEEEELMRISTINAREMLLEDPSHATELMAAHISTVDCFDELVDTYIDYLNSSNVDQAHALRNSFIESYENLMDKTFASAVEQLALKLYDRALKPSF